jgi:uncharacterized surface protein with fasciclin (FAS1) repeats
MNKINIRCGLAGIFSKGVLALTLAGLIAGAASAQAAAKVKSPTIVEVALTVNAESGEFSTLIAALQHAGLVDALNGKKQFTVFAPTDAAFAKLGLNAENISTLPVEQLQNILLYHVARGERLATDVLASSRIRMLNDDFAFLEEGKIDGAGFVLTDVDATNGVIHVVDTVLLPPAE